MPPKELHQTSSSATGRTGEGHASELGSGAPAHLASIDKLLSTAFELMKQEPAVDRLVFEQLRQVRVRIRHVLSGAAAGSSAEVPNAAPALYQDRPRKDEGPISFTARTYSRWLGKYISRADIKRLDVKLYNALYNLPNPDEELDKIGLYTKKQLNDIKLSTSSEFKRPPRTLKLSDMSPQERESARLFNLARRRKQRAAKR